MRNRNGQTRPFFLQKKHTLVAGSRGFAKSVVNGNAVSVVLQSIIQWVLIFFTAMGALLMPQFIQ
ncbi:MAG: hypothetical protein HOI42_14695 [Candidatus Marinimicrobia bacterium]|nr:hypothetical protein [Candidatus Neomarinimicrobiota bacterium]